MPTRSIELANGFKNYVASRLLPSPDLAFTNFSWVLETPIPNTDDFRLATIRVLENRQTIRDLKYSEFSQ